MKIVRAKSASYYAPAPGSDAGAEPLCKSLVEVETDGGLTGLAVVEGASLAGIESLARSVLVGEDPRASAALWERMVAQETTQSGSARASAALDLALWDLKSKLNQEPLWKTLGGGRPNANVYLTCPDAPMSITALSQWCVTAVRESGFCGIKLPVGLDLDADLERLGCIAAALSSGSRPPALMIDARERWSAKESVRAVSEMESTYDLTWVEAPARRADFLGLKQVSQAIRAAVCAARGMNACGDYLAYLHHRAVDVVQLDLSVMGITGALRIADAAFGFELPVTVAHCPGDIGVHLAGALPYFMSVEIRDTQIRDSVLRSVVSVKDGWATCSDAAGNGLSLDRAMLRTGTAAKATP